jgi:hypothetical protein
MNQEQFPVYPPIKKTLTISKFKYNILEIKLFESIRIAVYLYGDNDLLIEARQYIIDGEQYKKWSSDDQYILTLIKQKIQEPWIL